MMKIMKHSLKRIGVTVLVAFFMFSNNFLINVSAKDIPNSSLINKYGVKLTKNKKDSNYTLKLTKNIKDKDNQKMEFEVIEINDKDPVNSYSTLKYAQPIKNIVGQYVREDDDNIMTVKVKSKKKDPEYGSRITMSITIKYDGDSYFSIENPSSPSTGISTSSQTIDCSTVNSHSSEFNQNFCRAKTNAINAGNSFKLTEDKFDNDKIFDNLKCNANSRKITVNYKTNKTEYDRQYYQNASYYYAYNTTTKDLGQYTYEYSPGITTKGDKVSCKITCEEAVIVEYGPPVASKAGLCFEYKVKVTSRVSCGMEEEPNRPTTPNQYCTPSPYCTHGEASYKQGGPNEEYDKCIEECDGGQYTQSCSTKCYNKVYSSTTNTKTSSTENSEIIKLSIKDNIKTAAKQCAKNSEYNGCYYKYTPNGKIYWYGNEKGTNGDVFYPGRWYLEYPGEHKTYKPSSSGRYYDVTLNDGFYRKRYTTVNGSHCNDSCTWIGCDDNLYLNPGYIAKDADANNKIYEDAVKSCTAAAKCETTTATFTISVKYDTDDNKAIKLNFPYETKNEDSDYVKSPAGGNSKDTGSTLLDYGGCYKNEDAKNIYMTEWSFPGTWINNKTGEITFDNKTGTTGWYTESKKFCLPLNIKNVNTNWWNWKVKNDTSKSIDTIQTELNRYSYERTNDSSNGYNIKATTRNFGKFGWNFNIYCFYAVNAENDDCDDDDDCPDINIKPGEGYTIRTVDTSNLFPNTNTTDITKNRAIGFNWTSAATIPESKNSAYAVDPSKLIEIIQNNSQTLYSNESENLDYSFNLSIEDLNAIRKYNKTNKYGTWGGNTITKNGVNVYQSNLFRSGTGSNMILDSSSINKLGTVGLNNQ